MGHPSILGLGKMRKLHKYSPEAKHKVEHFLSKHYELFLTESDLEHIMELAFREYIQPIVAYIIQEYQVKISFLDASRLIDMAKGDDMLERKRKKLVEINVLFLPNEWTELQNMLAENLARAESELKVAKTHFRREIQQTRIQRLKRMRTKLEYNTIIENTQTILP